MIIYLFMRYVHTQEISQLYIWPEIIKIYNFMVMGTFCIGELPVINMLFISTGTKVYLGTWCLQTAF